ncbi:MAG: sulfite exporter TauE/SafE family protein [Candidatus Aminicenantes bacterium]|nr:sulfite exporter TauE/SafE family protein [Candidatus Aminicenantes bacterium]
MSDNVIMAVGLAILSFISGMLGLGVALVAIPFLGLFLPDLVHQVQPLSLLLNGVTALLSTFGFARSGFVGWKKAIPLAAITTASAPLGAFIVQFIEQKVVWIIYFAAVFYLAYQLFRPVKASVKQENFKLAAILAVPISIMSGFLGVGPGFLLLPTLILAGFEPKKAAGINAFAVCPPSFSALIPHLSTTSWNLPLTGLLVGRSFIFLCWSQNNQPFSPQQTAQAAFCSFNTFSNRL